MQPQAGNRPSRKFDSHQVTFKYGVRIHTCTNTAECILYGTVAGRRLFQPIKVRTWHGDNKLRLISLLAAIPLAPTGRYKLVAQRWMPLLLPFPGPLVAFTTMVFITHGADHTPPIIIIIITKVSSIFDQPLSPSSPPKPDASISHAFALL